MAFYTFQVRSDHADLYRSSTDFVYRLRPPVEGCTGIQLIHGDIPPTTESSLAWNVNEMTTKNVYIANGRAVSGILRYDRRSLAVTDRLILDEIKTETPRQLISRLETLTITIVDSEGAPFSFGDDSVSIVSISVANPCVITTSANHGLSNGDFIHIRLIDNMNRSGKNNEFNTKHVVSGVTATTFTIPVDTTGQAANQVLTESAVPAVPLGSNAEIKVTGSISRAISLIATDGSGGSRLTFQLPHGFSVGQTIKITGMDNGATNTDNNRINQTHTIKAVGSTTQLDIFRSISDYTTPRIPTSIAGGAFLLGSNGLVTIDALQIVLEFAISSEPAGDEIDLSNQYRRAGASSVRDVILNQY